MFFPNLSIVIRELLLSHDYQVNPLAEALLFCAQRSQLIEEVVLPTLENGVIVLSDRSAYSSVAYQGEGRGLGYKKIYQLTWQSKIGFIYDLESFELIDSFQYENSIDGNFIIEKHSLSNDVLILIQFLVLDKILNFSPYNICEDTLHIIRKSNSPAIYTNILKNLVILLKRNNFINTPEIKPLK